MQVENAKLHVTPKRGLARTCQISCLKHKDRLDALHIVKVVCHEVAEDTATNQPCVSYALLGSLTAGIGRISKSTAAMSHLMAYGSSPLLAVSLLRKSSKTLF